MKRTSVRIRTRTDLLERLQGNEADQSSWEEFYRIYWRAVYGYVIRFGVSGGSAEDLVQEVFIKIFRQLPKLNYNPSRGRFLSWVKTVTRTTVMDHFRRQRARIEGRFNKLESTDDSRDLEDRLPDRTRKNPDDVWEEQWESALFVQALERVRERVKEETYQAFCLYCLENLSAKEVADRLKIPVNTVYISKLRIIRSIREEIEKLLKEV